MRINSVPDVKCFYNNKNVLRAKSMVRHFMRHPVCEILLGVQQLQIWWRFEISLLI